MIDFLKDEEIVFGTVFNDGSYSRLLTSVPTAAQLREIWALHPGVFAHHDCECGSPSYAYAQYMKEDPRRPGHVGYNEMMFYCPLCGRKTGYGTNYFRSQMILQAIRDYLGE